MYFYFRFREGKLGIDNVYYTDEIFMNFQKGEKARDSDLENAFKTKDKMKIIEVFIAVVIVVIVIVIVISQYS